MMSHNLIYQPKQAMYLPFQFDFSRAAIVGTRRSGSGDVLNVFNHPLSK